MVSTKERKTVKERLRTSPSLALGVSAVTSKYLDGRWDLAGDNAKKVLSDF